MVQSEHRMESKMAEKRTEEGMKKKREYTAGYDKENRVQIAVKLNRVTEADLLEAWNNISNKAKWFKDHLREELEKQKAGQ